MQANEHQVGGNHYKTANGREHWDIVEEFNLDYFQGQITKYLFRWEQKGGIRDLEKARHFLDKYIEIAQFREKKAMATKCDTRTVLSEGSNALGGESPRRYNPDGGNLPDARR